MTKKQSGQPPPPRPKSPLRGTVYIRKGEKEEERQAKSLRPHRKGRRLDLWVPEWAWATLERLEKKYGNTKTGIVVQMIKEWV